jgi:hypothetical protein
LEGQTPSFSHTSEDKSSDITLIHITFSPRRGKNVYTDDKFKILYIYGMTAHKAYTLLKPI